jgi:hypothetical protein
VELWKDVDHFCLCGGATWSTWHSMNLRRELVFPMSPVLNLTYVCSCILSLTIGVGLLMKKILGDWG